MRRIRTNLRAFTLVELLTALVIMSMLSLAVVTILMGAARTNMHVTGETGAIAQAENAARRIMHNLRTASSLSDPAAVATTHSLTLTTQPDSGNGNATYTVTYALSGRNLTESDPRYNVGGAPNVIATNVSAFDVTRNATSAPQSVTIRITIGTSPAVTRSLTVYCRNL
jgi:prepilin-type N-terminal cleavage/methylation domain-containing protein